MLKGEDLLLKLLSGLVEEEYRNLWGKDKKELNQFVEILVERDARWRDVKPMLIRYVEESNLEVPYFEQRKEAAWLKLHPNLVHGESRKHRQLSMTVFAIAASLFLIGFAFIFLVKNYEKDHYREKLLYTRVWKSDDHSSRQITLPDGTQVWLNKHTTLSYLQDDGLNLRRVKLDGEAYFEVKSSVEKPFQVFLEKGAITVTGTHFFTGYRRDTDLLYVDLKEGKVAYQPYGFYTESIHLSPQERLLWKGDGPHTLEKVPLNPATSYLWLRKAIQVENVPLSDLLEQLHAWYDVSVKLDQPDLAAIHFSGALSPEDSFTTNLEKICWTSNINLKKTNNTYILFNK
ncbi:FecR family protein [Sphingobacterium sp. LRF_L2]|uniref:FecR family protein n=1 Tax=Sphingobacterium sp. LRF_L2 TaxID=3369421 RepID=UPI003F63ECAC